MANPQPDMIVQPREANERSYERRFIGYEDDPPGEPEYGREYSGRFGQSGAQAGYAGQQGWQASRPRAERG